MGQKVSPHGFRVGVIKDWDSKWYANKKNLADYLVEDNKVREPRRRRHRSAEERTGKVHRQERCPEHRRTEKTGDGCAADR